MYEFSSLNPKSFCRLHAFYFQSMHIPQRKILQLFFFWIVKDLNFFLKKLLLVKKWNCIFTLAPNLHQNLSNVIVI